LSIGFCFSFPVEKNLDVNEIHTLKSLRKNSRLDCSNRSKSLKWVGKSNDVQVCVHALLQLMLCLFLKRMRSRDQRPQKRALALAARHNLAIRTTRKTLSAILTLDMIRKPQGCARALK
jgi:hypothetical protein